MINAYREFSANGRALPWSLASEFWQHCRDEPLERSRTHISCLAGTQASILGGEICYVFIVGLHDGSPRIGAGNSRAL